jgi:glutamate synthase domain-containing protein 1
MLAAIGAVTVEFALLEMHLEAAIWGFLVGNRLEDQPTGRIVTAELSFQKAVHLFSALLRHRFPHRDDSDLKKLCAQLTRAEEERNAIVHSTWALAAADRVMRIKMTAKGKLKTRFYELSVSDIRAIALRIHTTAEDLLNFYLSLVDPHYKQRVTL